MAVIANGGVKKSNIAIAIAHIWKDNTLINQPCIQAMNAMPIEAELMAIRIGLISAMESNDTYSIIVITNSIIAAKKILESQVNPFQNIVIPLATKIKSFLGKDNCNNIHFWYCPSKTEWPRHKIVNSQVKVANNIPILLSRNSFLFSKKEGMQ